MRFTEVNNCVKLRSWILVTTASTCYNCLNKAVLTNTHNYILISDVTIFRQKTTIQSAKKCVNILHGRLNVMVSTVDWNVAYRSPPSWISVDTIWPFKLASLIDENSIVITFCARVRVYNYEYFSNLQKHGIRFFFFLIYLRLCIASIHAHI